MRSFLVFIGLVFILQGVEAQDVSEPEIDSLYREDQFYIGVTYNLLGNRLENLSQTGFSSGFHLGFIRDMPINKDRDFAIGIGLGYSSNSFNQNLLVSKDNSDTVSYTILNDNGTYSKNKFSNHLLELPIEFRWRTSTPTDYDFWRIYAGFKLGYMLAHTTKYKGDLGSIRHTNIDDFNKLQYGLTLSAGYNTWNIYLYYGLNPVFSDSAKLEGSALNMNSVKVGLMFYIL